MGSKIISEDSVKRKTNFFIRICERWDQKDEKFLWIKSYLIILSIVSLIFESNTQK